MNHSNHYFRFSCVDFFSKNKWNIYPKIDVIKKLWKKSVPFQHHVFLLGRCLSSSDDSTHFLWEQNCINPGRGELINKRETSTWSALQSYVLCRNGRGQQRLQRCFKKTNQLQGLKNLRSSVKSGYTRFIFSVGWYLANEILKCKFCKIQK